MSTSLTELLTVLAVVGLLTAGACAWCGNAKKQAPAIADRAYGRILRQVERIGE